MGASEFVEESELHAFVDGELDPERQRQIADHLVRRPEDAALVEAWRRQNAALRGAFAQTAQEPLPVSLQATAPRANANPANASWTRSSGSGKATPRRPVRRLEDLRRSRRRYALVSSIMTLLAGVVVASVAILAFTGSASPPEEAERGAASTGFVARANVAYLTFAKDARPVEIGADRSGELAAWLAERAGFGTLPDLSREGLRFIGGRLVPGAAGAAGLLLYETPRGERVELYFERAEASAAPSDPLRAAPGLAAIEWRAAGMAFVLLGPLPAETMQAAAERAARAISGTAESPSR
ncbi:MAG: anti-sigma factor [Methylocystis sp.]|nr:anti-sigma factor [Methylocystis sp.]MBI3274813.1 anti-sigma factor [Methylocystis sp.]